MNPGVMSALIMMWVMIFVIILPQQRKRKTENAVALQIIRKKKNKECNEMVEIAKQFIGKVCEITTLKDSISIPLGVVKDVLGNAVMVEQVNGKGDTNGVVQAFNLDFVVAIKEVKPKVKKQK